MPKWFVLVLCTTACGSVGDQPSPADAQEEPLVDAPIDAPPPRVYRARLPETAPVMFGGGPLGYCLYTIQLRQLDVQLAVTTGGVVSGQVQALNIETPAMTCPHMGIPPMIANYTFQSAIPTMVGQQLVFRGAAANFPRVNLVVDLTATGAELQARLAFHRTDQPAPLDWTVTVMVPMIVQ
jgi:hypothetical protein